MLVVTDINTMWRRKPFEAVARMSPVLGVLPMDPLAAVRKLRTAPSSKKDSDANIFQTLPLLMPFSWASDNARLSLKYLWARVESHSRRLRRRPMALIVTTPHYLSLVAKLRSTMPCFYYCSDDFRSYSGWNQPEVAQMEIELVKLAHHSFFVSKALASRARTDSGVQPDRISVSMNATDSYCLRPVPDDRINSLLQMYPAIRRPIAGVVGVINDRVDFELLERCAQCPQIGSLLIVGPVEGDANNRKWQKLRQNSKVIHIGARPHEERPAWMQLLDIALIPYAESEFNHYCSPMRLFDHLASGVAIVATAACDQLKEFAPWVSLSEHKRAFEITVSEVLQQRSNGPGRAEQINFALSHTWETRAVELHRIMEMYV